MNVETKEVYKAIATVTRALGRAGISKGRQNAQQGYSFRGIDDIYNALNSELANANLCIIPRVLSRDVAERQGRSGSALFYVTIQAEYDIVSAVDGSCHTASAYGEAMDSGDKATNKAMSAAYKYMAMQLFCIPTEGDNDADASTHEVAASYQPTRQQQPAPRQAPAIPAASNGAPVCPVHKRPMREGKNGGYFCSTKLDDGSWCKERQSTAEPATRSIPDDWDADII